MYCILMRSKIITLASQLSTINYHACKYEKNQQQQIKNKNTKITCCKNFKTTTATSQKNDITTATKTTEATVTTILTLKISIHNMLAHYPTRFLTTLIT